MQTFDYTAPGSLADVFELLADDSVESRLLAGGTGLVNLMKQRLAFPERIVSLHRIEGLRGVTEDQDLQVGALTRLADLEHDAIVQARLPVLCNTLREVASPRIRSMATIGGAIAHGDPAQDTTVTLLALDASVGLQSAAGTRTLPLASLYVDYYETAIRDDEMLTAVSIPLPHPGRRFYFHKFTPGSMEDYACVTVCTALDVAADGTLTDVRIALGSVGSTVLRATAAEQLLEGSRPDAALLAAAGAAAADATDPVADTRGSVGYKQRMTGVWTRRALAASIA